MGAVSDFHTPILILFTESTEETWVQDVNRRYSMQKIKVLLVDDSAVIRKVLGDLLAEDPSIEVVGTAPNGKVALDKIASLKPDIVTLDIEMPEMNGLQAVREIRSRGEQLPIIMCSSLTAEGASHTLEALSLGASDYVTKPSSHGVNTREVVGDELIRKIKALVTNRESSPVTKPVRPSPTSSKPSNPIRIVAIGVSTGGPNALMDLLPQFPSAFGAPIVIVQHMPALFTKMLAERLNEVSKLPVCEAAHGQEIAPGQIYIAPGGFHLEVKRLLGREVFALNEGEPENSCRPAVDVLFRSVAKTYRDQALGVVLTGMGSDGLKGAQAIKEVGGVILVQDRESSAVWGMPGAIVDAGMEPIVLPLGAIANEVTTRVCRVGQSNINLGG
jgi:two-component system chemotaxis response regulator CheB